MTPRNERETAISFSFRNRAASSFRSFISHAADAFVGFPATFLRSTASGAGSLPDIVSSSFPAVLEQTRFAAITTLLSIS